MNDLTLTRSGELDVTQVEGNTDKGVAFVDAWMQTEMIVVDANQIIIRDTKVLEAAAEFEGLTIGRDLVASEKPGGL